MCIRDSVEGAEVGDILKIEIEDIKLRSWGVMRSSTTAGVFHEKYEKREEQCLIFLSSNWIPMKTVSYTHLDVYKRQAVRRCIWADTCPVPEG